MKAVVLLWACLGALVAARAVEVRSDVAFLAAGRAEKLDLYLPAADARNGAAVVWIHGGGWTSGDKARSREKNIGTTLAGWGYVVASVNYRMGDGAWPQNLHDVKNAVRFLRAHAEEFGLDPARIAIAGGSAGGHLALMAAFTADRSFEPGAPYPGVSSAVRAVVDFYGPVNHLTRRKPGPDGRGSGEWAPGDAVKVFAHGDAQNRTALTDSAPITYVRAGVPPVFIAHGLADETVNREQSEELAAALARAGVPHEIIWLPGIGHTFDLAGWNGRLLGTDVAGPLRRFLARWLAPAA